MNIIKKFSNLTELEYKYGDFSSIVMFILNPGQSGKSLLGLDPHVSMIEKIYSKYVIKKSPLEYIRGESYDRALDVGCGNGRISEELSGMCTDVYGVELNRDRLMNFNNRGVPDNQQLLQGDATALPFPDDYFDLVMSYTVYEHIPSEKIQEYLEELRRVLAPGGTAYLVNDAFFYRILRKSRLLYPVYGPDPTHINMVTPETMAKRLRDAGFEIQRLRYSPFHHLLENEPKFLSPFATKGYVVAKN